MPGGDTLRADLRERVVAAAAQLLEAQGLGALTVRRLAEAADVAPMSIYHHLGSKEGVLDAVLREAFVTLELAMRGSGVGRQPLEALREAARRYRELALASPATYALMFSGTGMHPEASAETKEAALSSFEAFVAICQRLLDAGLVVGRSAEDLAQAAWASMHGAITLELAGLSFSDRAFELITELFEAGLTARR